MPESLRTLDSANPSSASNSWWLRSPGSGNGYAAYVAGDGTVGAAGSDVCTNAFGVRPAFYLNPSSVLFTSAATGGKHSNGRGADALFTVDINAGNEWKATLADSAHSGFTAAFVSTSNDAMTISYKNAQTGAGEYISAIITDSAGSTIKSYGRIAAATAANGSVTVNLRDKLTGSDKLYVFNEQYHDDNATDYASALIPIVPQKPALTVTAKDQDYVYNASIQGPGDVAYADPADIA